MRPEDGEEWAPGPPPHLRVRAYLIEELGEGLRTSPLQTISAENALEALGLFVGSRRCQMLGGHWVDRRARDHFLAQVRLEGREVSLRSSRWVS